ncbi:MAG: hypothetical protein M1294_10355 [Firmicutes bacterium]|jgi:glycerophosphoryl diester phosphodiesterase|uniref:GP-PDE domain-containing protein n=1 Tax=Sulfobacillus benefaciens TaxID=453960 RepID=A0A2T2WUS8_9FIRM|nr:hypothetical protein [Bacillota bacterium]MCL5013203.1 hypothetical protein [Bacillota bacterium]PSR25994.1 MAG: hypothetical protein C7B43_15390 [Sulfobacillus benefaciens]
MSSRSSRFKTFVWGHRGSAQVLPENTIPSLRFAVDHQLDGVEFDVQLTRDQVVVLLHDATLERTTSGSGWVGDYDWSFVRTLLTRGPDGQLSDIPIPRLEEVLEALTHAVLCIEYKNGPRYYPNLVEKTLDIVRHYHAQDRVMVSSFDQFALVDSARLAPDIPRAVAWGMGRMIEPWSVARSARASWVHVHQNTVPDDDLRHIKESGLNVAVWGLESRASAAQLRTEYVDAVFVDDPAWAEVLRR